MDSTVSPSSNKKNRLVAEVRAKSAFDIDSIIPLHIFPCRVNSTWYDQKIRLLQRYKYGMIKRQYPIALTICWHLPGAGTPQSLGSCQRNGCECGTVVQWQNWEEKQHEWCCKHLASSRQLETDANSVRQYNELSTLAKHSSQLFASATKNKTNVGSEWFRLCGYTPIFTSSLLAVIAEFDNVTASKANKRYCIYIPGI